MSYQVLARKWRPRRFTELVGQMHVVRALDNALATGRLHHAYLFTGTRGVGKTTIARILAKGLNCERGVTAEPCGECSACVELDEGRFVDLIEVDAASRAKVDETRDLMDNVQYAPARGRFKVYLIDEVHMFSKHSFNALLKTLEEPPPHVKFLLATTDPQKLPVTVLSRCLQFHLRQLPDAEIAVHLAHLMRAEGVDTDEAALRILSRAARGSMRDALSLLDQAIAYGAGTVIEHDVRDMLGVVDPEGVWTLLETLASGDGHALLDTIDTMAAAAPDFDAILADVLHALQVIAIHQSVPGAPLPEDAPADRVAGLSARVSREDVQLWYQIGIVGRRDLPYALSARSGVEMTVLRMLAFAPNDVAPAGAASSSSGAGAGSPPVAPPVPPVAPPVASASRPREASSSALTGSQSALPTHVNEAENVASPMKSPAPVRSNPPPSLASPPTAHAPVAEVGPVPIVNAALPDQAPQPLPDAAGLAWSDMVAGLSLGGLTKELAYNCEIARRADQTLVLRIAPAHAQLGGSRSQSALKDALTGGYEGIARVEFEIGERTSESPAEELKRVSNERRDAAAANLRADPNVTTMSSFFGATVDPARVEPNTPEGPGSGGGTAAP